MKPLFQLALFALANVLPPSTVLAGEVSTPALPPGTLTIVTTTAGGDTRSQVFDGTALRALPQHTFTTRTPWHDGPMRFTGPLLRDVLAATEAHGDTIHATALNDYRIEIPFRDAHDHDPIIAHTINDVALGVRTLGPFFLIYPFDETPALQSETYYHRSIWQLETIEVR